MQNYDEILKILNPAFVKLNEPLSKHTTVGIGGPADIWYETQSTDELIFVIKKARELNVPVTMLGRGSNVLVSDNGISGLVIRNASKSITIENEVSVTESEELKDDQEKITARWEADATSGTFKYDFKDLDYDESQSPIVLVRMDSGVDMPFAMNYLINQGITGLQWFSRIPGNLGGWIYNNVHGGTHFINEYVESVRVLDENSEIKELKQQDLKFDYDESRFHKTNEIILDAVLKLRRGDKERARFTAMEWAKRKSIQPSNTPGCVFRNLSSEEKEKMGYPTTATGYVIEHVLKMTGFGIGDAVISNRHHNFIENKGKATAKDYLDVIKEIQKRARAEINLELKPEIFFLGFTNEELEGVLK